VLADYDQHGRIVGGDPEQMMDAVAAAYVALAADGTDVLLMAFSAAWNASRPESLGHAAWHLAWPPSPGR
jgi:hypothetical protein